MSAKQLLCAAAVAACGFSGAAMAQQVIVQPAPTVIAPAPTVVAPAPVVVTPAPAPTVVYQPGTVTVHERPATTRPDGTSLAEDK
ncbi:MAG: hypothetical protein ACK4NA_13625 [Alphaproteobacteria bacterium]